MLYNDKTPKIEVDPETYEVKVDGEDIIIPKKQKLIVQRDIPGGIPKIVTGNWEWINYQPTGGSYSPQFEINSENVEWLETKWIYPYPEDMDTHMLTRAQTGSSAPPIIVDGVAYIAKNTRYIHAVSMDDGSLVWESDGGSQLDTDRQMAEFPYIGGPGAFSTFGHVHAMNYYRAYGWLIMSSWSCYLAAWNIEDGSLAWEMTPDKLCGTGAGKSNEELGNPITGLSLIHI